VMRLICSGNARGFICAIPVGLKQVFHDVGDNSIFTLLLGGLAIWNMNADPVFDPGTLKSHVRKLANNTSATDFDGRRLVGGPGGVTAMTRTSNRATADSVVTTWNADHLKGRKLAPALTDEKRVAWASGLVGELTSTFNDATLAAASATSASAVPDLCLPICLACFSVRYIAF